MDVWISSMENGRGRDSSQIPRKVVRSSTGCPPLAVPFFSGVQPEVDIEERWWGFRI
jgi:hypothetical protein